MGFTYVGSADYFHNQVLSSRLGLPVSTKYYRYIDGSATVKYYTPGRGDGQYYIHRAAFAQGKPQIAVLPEYISDDDSPRDLKQILAEESRQRAYAEFRALVDLEERQRPGFDPCTRANAAARCFVDTIDEDEKRTRKRIELLKRLMEARNRLGKIIAGDYEQNDFTRHMNQMPGAERIRQQEFNRLNNEIADLMAGASPTPIRDSIMATLANPRFQGSLMLVGGGFEMAGGAVLAGGGAATSATGVGAVVAVGGGALVANGADMASTGLQQIWTGQEHKTAINQAATGIAASLGASAETQATVSTITDAGQAVAGFGVGTAAFVAARTGAKAAQTTRAVDAATDATRTARGTQAANVADDANAARTAAGKTPNETPPKGRGDGETVVGDPVVVTRGEYIEDWEDFALEGTLPLVAKRYYGHQFGLVRGPLGRNRISPFDVFFTVTEHNTLEYVDESGNRIGFERPHGLGSARNAAFPHFRLYAPKLRRLKLRAGRIERHFRQYKDLVYRLEATEDLNGNRIEFVRDKQGVLKELRHSDGFRLAFANDRHGQRLSVTWIVAEGTAEEQQLRLVDYAYDVQGNMVKADCAASFSISYTYDEKNRLKSWRDTTGRSGSVFFYDDQDRVIRTETTGPWHNDVFDYDRDNRVTTYRPGGGEVAERFWYDENQNVIREETPVGGIKHYDYDNAGFKTGFTDEAGGRNQWRYDVFGNVTEHSDAEERFTHYAWNDFGSLNVAIDGEGHAWRYDYDVDGNLISAIDPKGNETRIEWTPGGQPAIIHFADGTQEQRFYDAHKRLIRIIAPGGGETTLTRDVFGRVVTTTAPDGGMTRFDYGTSKGKDFYTPAIIERPDGVRIERAFDAEGQIAHVRDGMGRQWHYHYGPFDQLVGIEEPGGGKLSFDYDVLKRLVRVTDAHAKKWVFERDGAGRVIREVDFSGQVFEYSYDIVGNITRRSHADGSYIEYTHDKTGLLKEERSFGSGDNLEDTGHYRYDRRGLLMRAENGSALVTLSRDELGRITQEGLNGRIVKSSFDAMGNRVKREIDRQSVDSLYDPLGQIAQLVIDAHQPLDFKRDVMGREVLRQSSRGFQLAQSYDPLGQLLHQKAGFALSTLGKGLEGMMAAQTRGLKPQALASQVERHYAWNAAFEPTHITDKRWGETSYSYDNNGQITKAQFADGTAEKFSYDPARNISGFGDVGELVHRWQAGAGGIVTKAQGPNGELIELELDSRNRVTSRKVSRNGFRPKSWCYEWDAKDRLIATITPEGERWTYHYDPFGRRVFKINSGAAKAALPLDNPARMAERQNRGAFYIEDSRTYPKSGDQIIVGNAYLWDGDVIAQEAPLLANGEAAWEQATNWHYEPNSFKPIAKQTPDGALFYIVTDHLGTPREMFCEDGNLAWAAQYRTWGAVKHIWQADNDNAAYSSPSPSPASYMRGNLAIRYDTVAEQRTHQATLDCPIRFQGQWEDAESGLYYNRHRYYDPLTASYLSPDPIGLVGGTRPNAYTHNPNTWVDPLGLAELIDPSQINWSQTSAGGNNRWGDIFDSMSKNGWNGPPIDVVRSPSGQLVTIDNTRLTAARDLNMQRIPVNIHNMNDPLPDEMRGRIFGNEKTPVTTWGEALKERTQKNKFDINGTAQRPKTPNINNPKLK